MTGVWLSPIYKSPMADFGYDISNFTDIHYEYGTLDDFKALARRCKLLGKRQFRIKNWFLQFSFKFQV